MNKDWRDLIQQKFLVIRLDDINEYLSLDAKHNLFYNMDIINLARASDGKNTNNSYIVINQDEPYIEQIVGILKANGHLGEEKEPCVLAEYKMICRDIEQDCSKCWGQDINEVNNFKRMMNVAESTDPFVLYDNKVLVEDKPEKISILDWATLLFMISMVGFYMISAWVKFNPIFAIAGWVTTFLVMYGAFILADKYKK